jgi:hypothetical protein
MRLVDPGDESQGREIMVSRIALAALVVVATASAALAQSASSTNFQTRPIQSVPASGNGQNKTPKIPPAARSGEKGLRIGPGAMQDDQFVTMKRIK